MKKMMLYSFLFVTMLVIVGGCGTEEGPDSNSLNIPNDLDVSENDNEKILKANNELGFKMLEIVEPDEKGNLFISPLSLFMALSMLYNGADGETKEEIAQTLEIEGISVDELNQANASLLTAFNKNSEDIELRIANSIWLNKKHQFQEEFSNHNQDYFNAEIQEIDILDSESPKMINDWVKQATNGKIPEIINGPLNPDLVTMLINAIYFNGDWMYEFDRKLTEKGTFYVDDKVTKDAQFMSLYEELSYMEDDELQAVVLPYGDGEMSMKVFLPKEGSDLMELEDKLVNEDLSSLNKAFQKREGTIVLPKFELEYEVNLNQMLKKLGMITAFDSVTANLSKMIIGDDQIWVDRVQQKTYIDVNEEGTEAAGVTSIEVVTESAPIDMDEPFYMEVNRPFFIMITDDETNTILFIGSIYNP